MTLRHGLVTWARMKEGAADALTPDHIWLACHFDRREKSFLDLSHSFEMTSQYLAACEPGA
jgi:hypothetical protein